MSANTADFSDAATALDLNNIRKCLMRMEDSIIFSLIERAQYGTAFRNVLVGRTSRGKQRSGPRSQHGGTFKLHQLKSAGSNGCLGDWFLYQSECLHSQVRRYLHPTEYSFFGPLPEPTLGAAEAETPPAAILAEVPDAAWINKRLLEIYRTKMVPTLCEAGDDGNMGSTAVQDVHCLQTMATRIYYGLFVAESKFRSERQKAEELIRAKDKDGLMAFITKPEVEARNIQRVILKARTFSQDINAAGVDGELVPGPCTYKIDAEYIGVVFRDYLMPLTKDVEVEYLLARLDSDPQARKRQRVA